MEPENPNAKTVRIINAVIGDGCRIDALKYSGSATVSEQATVGQIIKTET